MQRHYIFLFLSIHSVLTSMAMQEQACLTQVPDLVIYNTLKYLSTEQILRFREVNKQAQQVTEYFLRSNYSKKITINRNSRPSLKLVNKFSGITLQVTPHFNKFFNKLINNVAHIKALELDLLSWPFKEEKGSIETILTQVKQLEVLKILDGYSSRLSCHDYLLLNLLQELPAYTFLKKLHINSPLQEPELWDAILKVLPNFKKLEVLHIEGIRPNTTEQFIAFTQVLQTLQYLKKLRIHATRNKQEADALTKLGSILKNLRVFNLTSHDCHKTTSNTIGLWQGARSNYATSLSFFIP